MAKVDKIKECAQLVRKLKSLSEEKKTYRSKAIFNWKERKKLELLVKKIKQERDTANILLAETKQTLQEFQDELHRKNRSREEALKKASDSSPELEVLKQQFNFLKSKTQQRACTLKTNAKSNDTLKYTETEENSETRKALDAILHKVKLKNSTIRKLKNQKKVLLKEKKYLKKKIYQQARLHQMREAKQNIKIESSRKKIDSLRNENTRLRKLQIEKTDFDKPERQFKHIKRLKLERQAQESAIETLSDDLDILNKENSLLIQERDSLIHELRELKDQPFYAQNMKITSHKKTGLSMKMLQL